MRVLNEIRFDNLRGDLFGGLTAAIIALPMALAFGVASGAGPAAGLYGAVLVGLFASLFGSTPTLISEPTGPMTVVMTAVIASLIAANPESGMAMAFTVVMLAGLFQVLFGILKLGNYVTMMPYTVISGFMTGIGIILIVLQMAPFLGHAPPPGGVLGTLEGLPELFANIQIEETSLAVMTFALIVLFPTKLARKLPPQLVALLAGTAISLFFFADADIRRIGEIPTGLPELQIPVFSADQWQIMVIDAVVLAVLGSIDALLTSVIAENLTRKEGDSNKELLGQGMGNLASGLFGGIPGAGATMGTVVNIQTGGRSALSGLTRALLLLIVVLWAADLTAHIPLAVLAGIAMKVGFDIIDWSFIRRAHVVSKKAAWIMYGVIALTVFVDLITAVAIGVFIANLLTIDRMAKVQSQNVKAISTPTPGNVNCNLNDDEQTLLAKAGGRILLFAMGGVLTFGVAKAISRKQAVLEGHDVLIIDFTNVPVVGVSSALVLENMVQEARNAERAIYMVGVRGEVHKRLDSLNMFDSSNHIQLVDSRFEALSLATIWLKEHPTEATNTTVQEPEQQNGAHLAN